MENKKSSILDISFLDIFMKLTISLTCAFILEKAGVNTFAFNLFAFLGIIWAFSPIFEQLALMRKRRERRLRKWKK